MWCCHLNRGRPGKESHRDVSPSNIHHSRVTVLHANPFTGGRENCYSTVQGLFGHRMEVQRKGK